MTPDEERARKALGSLPLVDADPAFRQRLKADFVAGRLEGGRESAPRRRPARRGLFRPGLLVPAAVAAILLLVALLNRGPALELADVTGAGTITVDGQEFAAGDRDGLERAIRPGSRIELSDSVVLDVLYEETAAFRIASATATIPHAPGRWFGKSLACALENGEYQVLTGPAFPGIDLTVETPEGLIEVTGTLVSVVRDESGTCVCVHEGEANVGVGEGDLEAIPAGKRKVMFADGRPPIVTPIAPPHRDHLIEFEARYRAGIR